MPIWRVFGRALTEVQEITGEWFTSVQGGTFAPGGAPIVRRLREWGIRCRPELVKATCRLRHR